MAGIGDSWGTEEELLHPRGPDGKWIRKGGIAKSIIQNVLGFLASFRPRTFQNRQQASQYLQNVAHRQGVRRMGRPDQVRIARDLGPANADLRDGVIDEPSTQRFVTMMDRSATELPDDVILTRVVGPDAFGFTPQTAQGTNSDTDPGIRGMSGKLVADRGYGLTTIGGAQGTPPAGSVRMVIAAKKGTKVVVPAAGPADTTVFLDRGQPLRVTKVEPDGIGGWTMFVTADAAPGKDVPEPIAGPVGPGREKSKDRESRIRDTMQSLAQLDKTPDEQQEQADEEARRQKAAEDAGVTPVPSPQQEAERRRLEVEQQNQQQPPRQPAPGEPPPRTEPPVGRIGEPGAAPPAPGGAPAPGAPEPTPTPRRVVDIRTAVRDAGTPSPSRGEQLREWNEAYMGLKSGRLEPDEAVRGLDANIRRNRGLVEDLRSSPGSETRAADVEENIKAQEALRDLIREQYDLPAPAREAPPAPPPVPRTEAGLPRQPGLTPVKKAAPRKRPADRDAAARGTVQSWLESAGIGEADLGDMDRTGLAVVGDLVARRRISKAEAARRLRTDREGSALNRIADAIETAPRKKAAKKAAPVKKAAALAKKAPAKKAAPEATGDPLDRMTKADLIAEGGRRGVTARQSWNKDRIKQAIRDREGIGAEAPAPVKKAAAPAKKAAKAAVPGAAPGTAAGKITAGRLQPGDRILVDANGGHTTRKTGSKVATVQRIDRIGQGGRTRSITRIQIHATDEDGKTFIVGQGGAVMRGDRVGFSPSQTFIAAPEPGAAPAKKATKAAAPSPDLEQAARDRQAVIDRGRRYGRLRAEVEELVGADVDSNVLRRRIVAQSKADAIPGEDIKGLLDAVEGGDRDQVLVQAQRLTDRERVISVGHVGDVVPFDRTKHQAIGGDIPDGSMVHVVRPGNQIRLDGEGDLLTDRAVVEVATPQETVRGEQAQRLVPDGSVPGARTQAPVDNAPRKRELRKAMLDADLPPASPGSGRKSQEEIKGDLVAGRITPEEAIRRFESEIAFNKEDLTEVDAHLRESDLGPDERARVERHRANLQATIDSNEKHSEFLRNYFKDEGPVVSLEEAKVQDPVSYEFLKDATPDDLRVAAKEAGLDAPSGDTPDEMFTDLLKQVARNELARRAAKKAAKKAAPAKKAAKKAAPEVPRDKERVDARLLAEGLDLDQGFIDLVQRGLDGESVSGTPKNPTPRQLADAIDGHARARSDSTAIRFGNWDRANIFGNERNAEQRAEMKREYDEGMARSRALKELAERLRGVRRKKATPPAAKKAPEVKAAEAKVDDLEARLINDHLERVSKARSREQADGELEGLTLPELRRVATSMGQKGRSKRELRDKILDRFFPETPSPEAEAKLKGQQKQATDRLLRQAGIPAPETPAPRPKSLGIRIREAGITHPGETFSDVDSAIGDADRRLDAGESPTVVARFLRERAARVAKADIVEEGRRFKTEKDRDSLLSIRKSSAEYLRRVATHVQQEGKASRPAKKAAPTPPTPDVSAPSPSRTGTSGVTGDRSSTPEIPNRWGAMGTGGDVEFHPDGVVGNGIKDMGEDRLIDVDGEPLSNKLGKLVTRMNHGQISMDQLIDELNRLAQRLPEGSKARGIVERMGPELDAPKVKVDIPEGTPDVLGKLARALADNPLARGAVSRSGFRRDAENSELAKVMKMIEDFNAGRLAGVRMNQELQRVRSGVPHEANEGNAPILRALSEAVQEITAIMSDPKRRDLLARRTPGAPPAAKKASPRLTAIPGGRTAEGRGRGKRPTLKVVRNEDGEFSLVLA